MNVKNLVQLVAAAVLIASANCAMACECKIQPLFRINYSKIIDQANIIFVGEVLSVTDKYVTVSPIEVFKGKISRHVILDNASSGIGCNYFGSNKAHVGDRHLLFNAHSSVSVCSYSEPIATSGETLRILRKYIENNADRVNHSGAHK